MKKQLDQQSVLIRDLAMLVRVLCASLPDGDKKRRALEFLKRHNLQGSPLRLGTVLAKRKDTDCKN